MFQLSSEYQNVSLSHATMREQDLIQAFVPFLVAVSETHAGYQVRSNIITESDHWLNLLAKYETGELEPGRDDYDYIAWFVETLFDELNEIAPEGCYFGAHPGDGSDYGFWLHEELCPEFC